MEVTAGQHDRAAPGAAAFKIEALFYANDETYGFRHMHQALVRGGEQAGEEMVRNSCANWN